MNWIKVNISKEDIEKCWQFANSIIKNSNQYDRMNAKSISASEKLLYRIKRTFVGKIGEVAFKNLVESKGISVETNGMFEIYEGAENVDAFDFLTEENETIDVKTAVFPNHIKLVVPIDQFLNIPKNFYVGIKLELNKKVLNYSDLEKDSIVGAYVCGYCSHDELEKRPTINLGEFPCKSINLDKLHDINEIIKQIKKV